MTVAAALLLLKSHRVRSGTKTAWVKLALKATLPFRSRETECFYFVAQKPYPAEALVGYSAASGLVKGHYPGHDLKKFIFAIL